MDDECDKYGEHALECECSKWLRGSLVDHLECDKCGEHCLGKCPRHWSETEEGKQQILEILNQTFWFHPDGTEVRKDESCPMCKNELMACVCMGGL